MLITNAAQCEALIPVGENNRIIFRECMQTVAGGGYYNYEPSLLQTLPLSWIALFVVLAGVLLTFLVQILNNEQLTDREKWGYSIGVVCAPFVFIPLYLILSPAPKAHISSEFTGEDRQMSSHEKKARNSIQGTEALLEAMTFNKEGKPSPDA